MNDRERDEPREKCYVIERSDKEYAATFVFKSLKTQEMTQELQEKYKLAEKIAENTKVIDIRIEDERSKSKSPKSKAKKLHKRTKQTAVASIQKKL